MLVKIVEQPMDQSDSSAVQTQRQPVTVVSFVSTTHGSPSNCWSGNTPGPTCVGTPFTNHKCSRHG